MDNKNTIKAIEELMKAINSNIYYVKEDVFTKNMEGEAPIIPLQLISEELETLKVEFNSNINLRVNERIEQIQQKISNEEIFVNFDSNPSDNYTYIFDDIIVNIGNYKTNATYIEFERNNLSSIDDIDTFFDDLEKEINIKLEKEISEDLGTSKSENNNLSFDYVIEVKRKNATNIYVEKYEFDNYDDAIQSKKILEKAQNVTVNILNKNENYSEEEFKEAMGEFSKIDKKIEQRLG
jgi:preprotein translocase subunit SecD